MKITVGLHAHSTSVVSDGLESAADVLASGLVLFGLRMAAKPADEQHPYGHGRLETLSGLGVGMILIVSGALISFRSLEHAQDPPHTPEPYAIWPLLVSIVIKSIMTASKRRYGRKIRSTALTADAWNDAVDILSGCTALVALMLTLIEPERFAIADHLGGAAVGAIVIFLGGRIVHDTALHLMDTMPDPAAMDEIRKVAMGVPGVRGIEKCFARKTGLRWHVDLHLEVDPDMTVIESHEIATRVREKVREKLDWVEDVLVHVEPHLETTPAKTNGKS